MPHRLITLDPGHFHAALIQKTMLAGVDPDVHVYAPLGPDLVAHLGRIAAFNQRPLNPTGWRIELHASEDFLERTWHEKPGDVVVLAGRNRDKIRRIHAALTAGLHVLADKPWVLTPLDLPLLHECLQLARTRNLVATDILTERYEITSLLMRDLVCETSLVGPVEAVVMASVHGLIKTVAGAPLRRPTWFFDPAEQGEALTDVGVHLVDLVQWMLRPEQAVALEEIDITEASRRATILSRDDFERITGSRDFPDSTAEFIEGDRLLYPGNHSLAYTLGQIPVRLDIRWDRECPAGDRHLAEIRTTRTRVEVCDGIVRVHPNPATDSSTLGPEVAAFLAGRHPTVSVEREPDGALRLRIPDALHVGHEEHFAQVAARFLADLENPAGVPMWEDAYTCARYHVTTHGAARARCQPVRTNPHN